MRRLLGFLLVVISLSAGAEYFVLVSHYARSLPQSPRSESGAVIPMDDHGTRVFLTNPQQYVLWGLQLGGIITGAFGGLLIARGNR